MLRCHCDTFTRPESPSCIFHTDKTKLSLVLSCPCRLREIGITGSRAHHEAILKTVAACYEPISLIISFQADHIRRILGFAIRRCIGAQLRQLLLWLMVKFLSQPRLFWTTLKFMCRTWMTGVPHIQTPTSFIFYPTSSGRSSQTGSKWSQQPPDGHYIIGESAFVIVGFFLVFDNNHSTWRTRDTALIYSVCKIWTIYRVKRRHLWITMQIYGVVQWVELICFWRLGC